MIDDRKLIFTNFGFGVDKISERSVRKNLKAIISCLSPDDKDKLLQLLKKKTK